jgi:hypothetical protein
MVQLHALTPSTAVPPTKCNAVPLIKLAPAAATPCWLDCTQNHQSYRHGYNCCLNHTPSHALSLPVAHCITSVFCFVHGQKCTSLPAGQRQNMQLLLFCVQQQQSDNVHARPALRTLYLLLPPPRVTVLCFNKMVLQTLRPACSAGRSTHVGCECRCRGPLSWLVSFVILLCCCS